MKEIKGDLIELAKQGHFDIIAHGCNCFNTMRSGIAKSIINTWNGVDIIDKQTKKGDYNKLGNISVCPVQIDNGEFIKVLNCYTQYNYGTDKVNVNYDAIAMCMDKINHHYKGKRIGLPLIGCGLAGGKWDIVKKIIGDRLIDLDVTIVKFK